MPYVPVAQPISTHLRRPCKANITDAFAERIQRRKTNRWWSQQAEDEYYVNYFLIERGQSPGTYVELGANDGDQASNTRRLYEVHGWRGVLIEASPPLCETLTNNRPGDVVLCGAVCQDRFGGHVQFTTTEKTTGPSSLVGHAAAQGVDSDWSTKMSRYYSLTTFSVPCVPLGSMLASSGMTYADLFSLDVEQNELRVLRTINFTNFRFAVAFVELECPGAANSLSVQDEEVRALLTSHGYTYVMRQRGNDVWIDERVPWARRGAKRSQDALRAHSMPQQMIDTKCCGGKGAIDRTRCGGGALQDQVSLQAARTAFQRTAGYSSSTARKLPLDAHAKFHGGAHNAHAGEAAAHSRPMSDSGHRNAPTPVKRPASDRSSRAATRRYPSSSLPSTGPAMAAAHGYAYALPGVIGLTFGVCCLLWCGRERGGNRRPRSALGR